MTTPGSGLGVLQRIQEVLREHGAEPKADDTSRPGYRVWRGGCSGCDWTTDSHVDVDAYLAHVASAVQESLELLDTVRLMRSASVWIADSISGDDSGEPWLMTRTLLNQMIGRVDALGGWPQEVTE